MQPSNNATTAFPDAAAAAMAGFWSGSLGFTVRCTPRRRTLTGVAADGRVLFGKLRERRGRDAAAEWHWLHDLPRLGFQVPAPVALERRGRRTLVCTEAVRGRQLDALLHDAIQRADRAAAVAFACRVVAPAVRRLHDAGLVYRDLYWPHLFARSLAAGEPLVFLDVERVFRPRWRRRRWIVKDLAGLLASAPAGCDAKDTLRFLRGYLGSEKDSRAERHRLAQAVMGKAARIRAHRPRYG